MHPEADAFLDAIFDNPDDDTPRLVYADWLQEHDQEHYAQFIRLQCAAARERFGSDEANRLWEEIGRVWNRLRYEWWPATFEDWGWGRWGDAMLDAVHFERGLLRPQLPILAEQIRKYSACRAWLPSFEVSLAEFQDLIDLASMPLARRLRKVTLARSCDANAADDERDWFLAEFVCSEFTRGVRVLDLSRTSMRNTMAQLLLDMNALPGMEELHIAFGDWSDCDPDETTRQLQARYKCVIRH